MVGVLDFAMEHDYGTEAERWRDKLVHRYRLREDETREIMNSKLEFRYLEVGAYRKEVTERSGIVEKWMYVLKNLSRLEGRPPELRERVTGTLSSTHAKRASGPDSPKDSLKDWPKAKPESQRRCLQPGSLLKR